MRQLMQTDKPARSKRTWAGIVALAVAVIVIVFFALFNWNLLKPALARTITAKTGRHATIDGDLRVHLFSWQPTVEIDGLSLENPDWADRRIMFSAKRIVVSVSLKHLLGGHLVLPRLEIGDPSVNLERDAKGRASWELGTKSGTPNRDTKPVKLPTIQRLTIENGKVHVVDQVRKLTFTGSLVAADKVGADATESADPQSFKLRSKGTLNEKPFRLDADGGPLLDLEPDKPYSFTAHLTASDIDLDTQVTVPKPFDLSLLDAKFTIAGSDLADVFYLTGLALPNTPKYRLSASLHVDGTRFTADDLKGHLGSSDLAGKLEVQTGGVRPKLTAKISSRTLNIVDLAPTLGESAPPPTALATPTDSPVPTAASSPTDATHTAPAVDDTPAATNDGRLFPDANLQVNRVRGMDADVTYRAASVVAPKVPMKEVNFHLVLDDGVLTLDPLSFVLDAGKFSGKVRIDARKDEPVSDIDMRLDNVDMSQFKSATAQQAPLAGALSGRFKFHGTGTSVHKFASTSDGSMSIVVPHGRINDAIAELTGINVLKGLGLLVSKDQAQADIRCGIVDFKDRGGVLNTTTVYMDTSNVLITGRGKINLGSETLDLALQGDPKKVTLLRLRSPISLHGTFLHPAVGIEAGKVAEQVGIATALGALLTPAAAALAFIDPGLAKDKDCSTLVAQAAAGVSPQ